MHLSSNTFCLLLCNAKIKHLCEHHPASVQIRPRTVARSVRRLLWPYSAEKLLAAIETSDYCPSVSLALNDIAARNHRPNLVPGAYGDERE